MTPTSERRSATARAYDHIKQAIINGQLAGGQLITESEVGDELGISRTPVHTAFIQLGGEHLLELAGRRGAVVTPIAPNEAQDVLDMRQVLEGAAAQRVADRGGPSAEVAHALAVGLEQQRRHAAAEDLEAFVAADEAFHTSVVHASGNAIAVHFFALLRDRQQRLRHQLLSVRPHRLTDVVEDHRKLLDRLSAGDAAGYAAVLSEHVARHQGAL